MGDWRTRLQRGQEWAGRAAVALGLGPRESLTAFDVFTRDAPYTDAVITVVYLRRFDGLPVVNDLVKATFTTQGEVRRTTRADPIPGDLGTTPTIDAKAALRDVKLAGLFTDQTSADAELVVHTRPTVALAWEFTVETAPSEPYPSGRAYVDATTASLIEIRSTTFH